MELHNILLFIFLTLQLIKLLAMLSQLTVDWFIKHLCVREDK